MRKKMEQQEVEIIDLTRSSSSKSKRPRSKTRAVFVMNEKMDMDKIETRHDCFILDFNPSEVNNTSRRPDSSDDVCVLAEKGQVACRDYPHPRHLCARYPFLETPPPKHCDMCYCCACDVVAPCKRWSRHCFATKRRKIANKKKRRTKAALQPLLQTEDDDENAIESRKHIGISLVCSP